MLLPFVMQDKYQRYKMLGAKAKEIESKVGGYIADEDEVVRFFFFVCVFGIYNCGYCNVFS